jgi:hypothetical protein
MRALWLLLLCSGTALADTQVGGHIKVQPTATDYPSDNLSAVYGEDPALDQGLDLRLKLETRGGGFDAAVHYELLGLSGDSVSAWERARAAGLPTPDPLPSDARRLFDLTDVIHQGDTTLAVQRLDRLSLGYSTPSTVLRIGRQAVSWGNGLAFQVLDFINPFAPLTVDKDYKTGDDMLYGQYLFASGDDLQAMLVPRRDPSSGGLRSHDSTLALKYHAMDSGLDLLAAAHYGQPRLGIGISHSLGEAVGRLDLETSRRSTGGWELSLVANLDYSWVWLGRNVYGFAEYFHSGVGAHSEAGYASPDPELADRIARGELYTLGRDYVATGLDAELTPLVHLKPTALVNLDDGSGVLQVNLSYDWTESVQLLGGLDLPWGGRGSEYGGIPVPGTPWVAGGGSRAYLRLGWYF